MNFTKTMMALAIGSVGLMGAVSAQAVDSVVSMTVQDLGTVWTGGTAHVDVNSGIGSHTAGTSGGTFYFRGSIFADTAGAPLVVADGANSVNGFDAAGDPSTQFASSWGTTGAGILNGTNQTSFGGSFVFGSNPATDNFTPNSNDCAGGTCVTGTPAGSVVGNNLAASVGNATSATNLAGLIIDLGDFGGFYQPVAANFRLNPNGNPPSVVLRTSALGEGSLLANQFYYSLDWASTISSTTGDVSNGATGFNNFTADWHMEGVGTIAAVPEASTYGMMLAGLGLVGFAVRRRNQA